MRDFDFQLRDPLKDLNNDADGPESVPETDGAGNAALVSTPSVEAVVDIDDVETDDAFSYDGYQVVRGEFFAHINEPSITFNNSRVALNSAAVNKLPDTEFVQILVNPESHQLVVKPSTEDIRDSFLWSSENKKNGKRKPKQITCRIFFAKVFELMGWNPDYRYKMLGKLIRTNDGLLFLFDLDAAEIYRRTVTEDGRTVAARKPVFPEDWKNQFGLPVEEHQKKLQVSIFEDYAVFGIRREEESKKTVTREPAETVPDGSGTGKESEQ